jgi:hypothetical protein
MIHIASSRWLPFMLCWLWSCSWAAKEPPAWTEPVLATEEWRQALTGTDLAGTFEKVTRGIRYEPYPGVMRGPRVTAVAAAGNAWDQALLLATLLRDQGYRVRFARGNLSDENRLVLLRGLYPPVLPSAGLGLDFTPFDLGSDAAINGAAADHLWIEVAQGNNWLPLDPSFPRAIAGAAYAEAEAHFDRIPPEAYTYLTIALKQVTTSGETRELFSADGTVERLALRPLWLTITSSPLMPAERKSRAASLTFSATSEPEEPDSPPVPKGTNHHWAWGLDQLETRRGTVTVLDEEPGLSIEHEWLELTIDFPDGRRRVVERDLRGDELSSPTGFRRYQLLVAPGRVPLSHADAVEQRVLSSIDLEPLKQELAAAGGDGEPASARALEQSAGTLAHYLLALRFAAESDALSDRISWVNGVALVHHQPRLILTSAEVLQGADKAVSPRVHFDLRLNEVLALPYPGFPIRTAALFQAARGMQESVLEGAMLAELNQDAGSLSTARYMEHALAERVPLQVLTLPGEGGAALPAKVRTRIDAALTGGARIVIPERAVKIDGRARWGWWQIDPRSGALVGVMDNGLHAGMTEYSLDLSKIALDDRMGMVIGAIIGATSTHITIAALDS